MRVNLLAVWGRAGVGEKRGRLWAQPAPSCFHIPAWNSEESKNRRVRPDPSGDRERIFHKRRLGYILLILFVSLIHNCSIFRRIIYEPPFGFAPGPTMLGLCQEFGSCSGSQLISKPTSEARDASPVLQPQGQSVPGDSQAVATSV